PARVWSSWAAGGGRGRCPRRGGAGFPPRWPPPAAPGTLAIAVRAVHAWPAASATSLVSSPCFPSRQRVQPLLAPAAVLLDRERCGTISRTSECRWICHHDRVFPHRWFHVACRA